MALEELKNGNPPSGDQSNKIIMDKSKMAVLGNGGHGGEATDILNVDQIKKAKESQQRSSDPNTEFLRAARAGDLERVIEFLESGDVTDINTSNQNGLNALHLASKDGHVEVVRELLNRGAAVNNATKKKNTALHIASLAGQKEVIKLLLQKNADVNVKSVNGFTPLYMAAQENHDACVRYLLAKGANQNLTTDDGFTPLAVAMQQGHEKVVAVLLENDTRSKVKLPALHIAAKKDDIKAASLLLENEHNPDSPSKSGFTPLHIAAHYGNIKIANLLIEKGADVNYQAKHNITPLHVACKWGKVNMVELLISKCAKIDTTTRDGLTPLHCAARNGNEEVINILLSNDAQILSKTKNGLTPLHMAAQGEHVDAARNLLDKKALVDEVTVDYLTSLHVASHCGHVKVAKLLLDRDADPNARALNGFTPLHIACKKNRIKVVELLLKHGASISATTESGLTPLHVASFMGCMNIVIYLLQCDASPDVPTVRGETPLHLAARANQTDVVRILLRNGAQVDTKAREEQTPLHVASRLGNIDIVMLLLQHGANIDSSTKDQYTALHIAAKEGQEEIAAALIENGASLDATTSKGFTPLHSAAKYGNVKIVKLLLQKGAKIDAQGKNGVTPLHVANHYNHEEVSLLLLENGASPHAAAKNGHTPLHIAAKKNQMEIATKLLEFGASPDAESKSGFTPIHLASQEGHTEMTALLLEHKAKPDHAAKNGLTPLHLCAQEDRVSAAKLLIDNGSGIDSATKAGYTPLHVAAHFGQINMVKYLLENNADVEKSTNVGYRPLHQAAQQGHTLIINLLLKHKADPNAVTNNGQTALNIADKLGYITVVETLKVVTETTTTVPNQSDEKYKVVAPEAMHETYISDSEDEGNEDATVYDNFNYNYMMDDMKNISDDQHHMMKPDHDHNEKDHNQSNDVINEVIVHQVKSQRYTIENSPLAITSLDNVDIARNPIHVGLHVLDTLQPCLESFGGHKIVSPMCRERFLVSFLVDARGGAMRGCRHSGVRVIVPPQSAAQPTRITCRYVKPQRTPNPPPLMEGEALVSRILELGPIAAKFLGPVILEVPHFASLRDKEREIVILRSDNGETWREHTLFDSDEAIQHVLNNSFEGDELYQLEDLHTNRITRIVTHDFPHFFAVISRIRQEIHCIGPEGGTVSSIAVPQVQAIFPANALTKRIKVGLQAQPIDSNTAAKLLGRGVAVSPVVTVEPRRRKFHKAITLSMPAPKAHTQGMINLYSGSENAPTLRLLCSITGGQSRAVWEDVTGSTPLTFVKDCVSFTTTVSARFWLMDCINISEASKMATDLYVYNAQVPFMVKFVVFAKRIDVNEAKLSVFCMTDDKEDKTLEQQEHFSEVAKSRDVEVLEGKTIYLEFAGNLIPILKSGDQLNMQFNAFKENRLAFTVRVKDQDDSIGRLLFMNDPKVAKGDPAQSPICTLNISLPEKVIDDDISLEYDQRSIEKNYRVFFDKNLYSSKINANEIQRGDIRLSDICNLLGPDWEKLAKELEIDDTDVELIKAEYPNKESQQAMIMLRLWLRRSGKQATGNNLEQALHRIKRSDIVDKCIFNLELVTDEMEKAVAKMQLDQSGFDNLKEELGPSRETSLHRNTKIDPAYCNDLAEKLENHIQQIEPNTSILNGHDISESQENDKRDAEWKQIRDESEILGISSKVGINNATPPPSPAEFDVQKSNLQQNGSPQLSKESSEESKVPPTAEQEHDFHHLSQQTITDNSQIQDDSNEYDADEDIGRSTEKIDEHGTKIPVAAKTSTPIKIKTIKKHSKVNVELKKQPPVTRPAVGDIDWDVKSSDIENSTTSTTSFPDAQLSQHNEPNEISSLALEDITSQANTSSDPTIIVSSDETGDEDILNTEINLQEYKDGENIDSHIKEEIEKELQKIRDENPNAIIESVILKEKVTNVKTETIREMNPDGSEKITIITETQKPNGDVSVDTHILTQSPTKSENLVAQGNSESDQSVVPNLKARTFESSSGSDVALHEPGAELSEDETDFYQNNEQPITTYTETTEVAASPDSKESVKTTVTTTTQQLTSDQIPSEIIQEMGNHQDIELRESLQSIVNTFVNEERKNY